MIDLWIQMVLTLFVSTLFHELILSERKAQKLIAIAMQRSGQHNAIMRYCHAKEKTHRKKDYNWINCHTELLWRDSKSQMAYPRDRDEIRWSVVCASKPRHPHSRPLRWYQIKTRCSLFTDPKATYSIEESKQQYLFEIIHWQEKS